MIFNHIIGAGNGTEHNGGHDNPFRAYVALPLSGQGPGLILLHEVYGVNAGLKAVADYYAQQGFCVICPNMYWQHDADASFPYPLMGEAVTEVIQRGRDTSYVLMNEKLNYGLAASHVGLAAKELKAMPECNGKVCVMGFCLGGRIAFLAAASGVVDAGVALYPTQFRQDVERHAHRMTTPFLFGVAALDKYVPADDQHLLTQVAGRVTRYDAAFSAYVTTHAQGNPLIETDVLESKGHAFARIQGEGFDHPAATLFHQRAIAFLQEKLGDNRAALQSPTPVFPRVIPPMPLAARFA